MSAVNPELPVRRRDLRAERVKRERRRGWWSLLRDIVMIVVIALVVSFLVKTFVMRSFFIPSGSMEQTLQIDDRILVDELTPRFTSYDHGDIVVFRDPGGWLPASTTTTPPRDPIAAGVDWVLSLVGLSAPDSGDHLIKRVIGLPGDHVVCCNASGQLEVNGTPLDERAYVKLAPGAKSPTVVPFDVVVPDGSLWVMGDNRDHSRDSRYNQEQPGGGFVPIDDVVGRAFLRTWPFDRFGSLGSTGGAFAGVPSPASSQGEP